MDIYDIINMVNDDLAAMSNEVHVDIDQLVVEFQKSIENNDKQWIAVAMKLQTAIGTYDGMLQLLGAQNAMELARTLVDIDLLARSQDGKQASRSRLVDTAYLVCYRYFASHDILERCFAAIEILGIVQRAGDRLFETYKVINHVEERQIFFGQILLAFAPYILFMQEVYPEFVDKQLVAMCKQMTDVFPGTDEYRKKLLPNMEIFADFIEKDMNSQ